MTRPLRSSVLCFIRAGDLCPDIVPLAEIDAVQALEPGLKDEGLVRDQLDQRFGDAMRHADGVEIGAVIAALRAVKPPAKRRVSRGRGWRPRARGRCRASPANSSAQASHWRAACTWTAGGSRRRPTPRPGVDQQTLAIRDDQEIGRAFALWRQQRRPAGSMQVVAVRLSTFS